MRRRVAKGGESAEFFAASFGHEVAELRFVIGKILEWARARPLLTHEKKRGKRHETEQCRGRAKGRWRNEMVKPRAESVIAGLIVIRDAENELLREQVRCCRCRFTTTATLTLLAFEKPAVIEYRGQFLGRAFIGFVVTLASPGEHDPDDMVKIVCPDRVQTHSTPFGWQQELWFVALVFCGDKSA